MELSLKAKVNISYVSILVLALIIVIALFYDNTTKLAIGIAVTIVGVILLYAMTLYVMNRYHAFDDEIVTDPSLMQK